MCAHGSLEIEGHPGRRAGTATSKQREMEAVVGTECVQNQGSKSAESPGGPQGWDGKK